MLRYLSKVENLVHRKFQGNVRNSSQETYGLHFKTQSRSSLLYRLAKQQAIFYLLFILFLKSLFWVRS